MSERMVSAAGVELWTEGLGDPADIPILLLMGASGQGILWPDPFCASLVEAGRYLIRYDHRDTGKSTTRDFAEHPYDLDDLASDALAILDAYDLEKVHLVGASMGGMIGQLLAIHHPHRVSSLVSMLSTPGGALHVDVSPSPGFEPLPPPDPTVVGALMAQGQNPPRGREASIEARIESFRLTAGSLGDFDEGHYRGLFSLEYDRAEDFSKKSNHGFAAASAGDRRGALAGVEIKTLIIHGTEDPLVPHAHARAMVEVMPRAELFTIEKLGHEMPPVVWPQVLAAILGHTASE